MTVSKSGRVLHVMEAVGGGTARHLIDVVRAVDAEHVVAIPLSRSKALTDPRMREMLRANGADVRIVPMKRSTTALQNFTAILRVRKLIKQTRPDVVHGHASVGGAVARVAAIGTGVPVVWTPHALLTSRMVIAIERRLRRATTTFIAVSPSEAQLAEDLGVARHDQITVIANGLSGESTPAPFDLRARLDLPHGTPIVLCIARLCEQKAPLDFVTMAALLHERRPDVHCVLIGEGPLVHEVDARIAELGLSQTFHRLEISTGASGLMPQADVFVLPSRYEGAPYVVLEAFRARVPVAATDVVGTRDAVHHDLSGLLSPSGDPGAMATSVQRLLEDHTLRMAVIDGGSSLLAGPFSLESMATSLADVYAEATAGALRTVRELPRWGSRTGADEDDRKVSLDVELPDSIGSDETPDEALRSA